MAEKRRKLDEGWDKLPTGVTLEKGGKRLVVSKYADGKRKRKYFPATKEGLESAKALAASIRKEKQTYGQKFGAITDDEKRAIDLWRAYREECDREGCQWVKMSDVMREAVERVRPQSLTPFFPEVSREWLLELGKKNISSEHLRKRTDKERRLATYFKGERIGEITPADIQSFLDSLKGRDGKAATPRTIQDYMVCLGHIFSFAVKRGIVASNPIKAMDKPRVKPEQDPAILTADDSLAIMNYAVSSARCRPHLPGLVLALFCGVRPAELARLRYSDLFNGGRPELLLSRTLTKTDTARRAKLRDNVVAWLRYAEREGLSGAPDSFILPGETENRRRDRYTRLLNRLSNGAGVEIPRDSLRHTAATMISALDGMGEAAEELGNDVRTLNRHYRHSVTRDEAVAFFSIQPPPVE